MATRSIFCITLLIATTACLASSVDDDVSREPKQLFAFAPPLPYQPSPFRLLPVQPAVVAAGISNQPSQRQYSGLGSTYVGVFPVLTGQQQQCPVCPTTPPANNSTCTSCPKCDCSSSTPSTPPAPATLNSCITTNPNRFGGASGSPTGTMTFSVSSYQDCVYVILADAPSKTITVTCDTLPLNFLGLEISPDASNKEGTSPYTSTTTGYKVTGGSVQVKINSISSSTGVAKCTWKTE